MTTESCANILLGEFIALCIIVFTVVFIILIIMLKDCLCDYIPYILALRRRNKHRVKCGLPKLKHL